MADNPRAVGPLLKDHVVLAAHGIPLSQELRLTEAMQLAPDVLDHNVPLSAEEPREHRETTNPNLSHSG